MIHHLSFTQITYPYKAIIKGDSVVVSSYDNLKKINKDYILFDKCKEENQIKSGIITNLNSQISIYKQKENSYTYRDSINNELITFQKSIIEENKKTISSIDDSYKEIISSNKKKTRRLLITFSTVSFSFGTIIGIIIPTIVK